MMVPFILFSIVVLCFGVDSVDASCNGTEKECPKDLSHLCQCTITAAGVNIVCHNRHGKEPMVEKIPDNLPKDLHELKMVGHDVKQINKADLSGCLNLQDLNLQKNSVSQIEQGAFEGVPQLEDLSLDVNQLDLGNPGRLPDDCFDPLVNLGQLWINSNVWGVSQNYSRLLHFVKNKPKLYLLTIDLIQGVQLPKLEPSTLPHLNYLFIYGGIFGTFKNNTLENWSQLPIYHLAIHTANVPSDEQLTYIEANSFSWLGRLESLALSFNQNLGFTQKLYDGFIGLNETRISILYLGGIVSPGSRNSTYLSEEFLKQLRGLNITGLYLDWNELIGIEERASISENLPHLQNLSLSYNRLFTAVYRDVLRPLVELQNLRYLNLNKQTRLSSPHDPRIIPLDLQEHTHLGQDQNSAPEDINLTVMFPKNLNYLLISDALDSGTIGLGKITIVGGPYSLKVIDLSENQIDHVEGPIILKQHPITIELFNLSACGLKFMNPRIFTHRLKIYMMDLSKNQELGEQINEDSQGLLISRMVESDMRVLDLHLCNIKIIYGKSFKQAGSLERIILRNNALSVWMPQISHLYNLKYLDISKNKFLYLMPSTMGDFDELNSHQRSLKKARFKLDLSDNPWQMDCGTIETVKWVYQTNVTLVNTEMTHFHKFDGQVDRRFNMSDLSSDIPRMEILCSSRTWVIATSIMSLVLVILFLLSVVVYRRRWDIRYFCLRLVRNRKVYQQLEDEREYEFDAFVAYHQNNLQWIINELIRNLEQEMEDPLKLCVHHRDWLPGPTIEENISRSVENSRKTLVVLSEKFLHSGWCEFELQMAKMRSIDEGQDIMIVVALEEIPVDRMNRTLINLRRTNTWLTWPTAPGPSRDIFWHSLRRAICTTN